MSDNILAIEQYINSANDYCTDLLYYSIKYAALNGVSETSTFEQMCNVLVLRYPNLDQSGESVLFKNASKLTRNGDTLIYKDQSIDDYPATAKISIIGSKIQLYNYIKSIYTDSVGMGYFSLPIDLTNYSTLYISINNAYRTTNEDDLDIDNTTYYRTELKFGIYKDTSYTQSNSTGYSITLKNAKYTTSNANTDTNLIILYLDEYKNKFGNIGYFGMYSWAQEDYNNSLIYYCYINKVWLG